MHHENLLTIKYILKYPFFLRYKKILVIDDDVNQLRLIKNVLLEVGLRPYCLLHPKNLKHGLDQKPHLIILDLYADFEGTEKTEKLDELCRVLKKDFAFFEIPVMFISASEKKEDIVNALESGANDFVKKPFFFEELLARIGVQFRILYMYDEIKKFLNTQESLSKQLLDLLEESRMQKEQIEHMNHLLKQKSITDHLTQVYNRGYLFNVLQREIARSDRYEEKLSLIMFDIDFFKKVNDTYGHMVGDLVLKGVVEVFKKRVRTSDLIARYGGEEFVILLTNTELQNAAQVAEEIRLAVSQVVFKVHEGIKIQVTISGGVTSYQPQESLDYFFVRLDEALYKAKNQGRNQIVVV